MSTRQASSFEEALGAGVRARRKQLGARQEDVAVAARLLGMAWTRPVVASIEKGARQLTVPELAVLLCVLDTDLRVLLRDSPALRLSRGLEIEGSKLAAALYGRLKIPNAATTALVLDTDTLRDPATRRAAEALIEEIAGRGAVIFDRMRAVWPEASEPALAVAHWGASQEAERKAAAKLRVEPSTVAIIAVKLWGASLTTHRDDLVRRRAGADRQSGPSLQAIRGHVTRELLRELRIALEAGGTTSRSAEPQ